MLGLVVCLGVPAKVIELRIEDGLKYAKVDLGGVIKEVIIATDDPIKVGDYVIVHAGIAISKIDEDEVKELKELWSEVIKYLG